MRPLRTAAVALLAALLAPSFALANAPTQRVAASRLVAVAQHVAQSLVGGADTTIAPAYAVRDLDVPLGAVAVAAGTDRTVTPTFVGVPVNVAIDGRLARTVVVGFRVTRYVRTAVAAHDLTGGVPLAAGDVAVAKMPYNGRPAVDPAALVGRRILAMTPKGATLYPEQTVADQLVRAGAPAVLVVRDGGVALSADVIARTGGALGEVVTVINPRTGKALAATVTGRNAVELELPEVPQ